MFKKFQSLINVKSKKTQALLDAYGNRPAHVLEKVHGANYQVSYDGTGFTVGSRRKQLGSQDSLYGDKIIRHILCDRVKRLYELIKQQTLEQEKAAIRLRDAMIAQGKPEEAEVAYESAKPSVSPTFKSVRVRGELYGGYYDHPDVADLPNVGRVGKGGVSYSQNVSCAAFALEIDDVVLPWIVAKLLLFSADIPTVPFLYSGTLEECIAWSSENNAGPTLIPNGTPWLDANGEPLLDSEGAMQALPRIEGNIREGHVIILQEPVELHDGAVVAFKDVNDKYAETCTKPKTPNVTTLDKLNDAEKGLIAFLIAGITEERLVTMFSYEEWKRSDFTAVIGKLVSDVFGEAKQSDPLMGDLITNLTTKARKTVTREVFRVAATELRAKFMELCDA